MDEQVSVGANGALAFLSGGGEMGARMRAHNWSGSPLGEPETWPQSLRSALSTCLNTALVAAVHWGPELRILYNDAYGPALAERHPWALGRPFGEVWSEIWDVLGPQIDAVLATGRGFSTERQMLRMKRHGRVEDTYWIYSFAPIRDESGEVAGIFVTALEITAQVVAERRLREGEERLHLALSAGRGIGTWDWDVPGDRVTADERFADLYGVDPEVAAAGAPIVEFFGAVHPDDLPGLRDAIAEALRTGEVFSAEYRLVQPDGTYRWAAAEGRCTLAPDGTPLRFPGVTFDVTARKGDEQHLRLLVNELNHRVKNSLSTVQAIAAQTFRTADTFERSKKEFSSRLVALAQAHDVLTDRSWVGATLREMIDRTVGPHGSDSGHRFRLDGPYVLLAPKSALSLSMAIHELCTNASKYGALLVEEGRVDIVWTVEGVGDDCRLLMTWTESGGPPVEPPTRKGFGSRLIEYGLAAELGGEVRITYEPQGVVCIVDAPLPVA